MPKKKPLVLLILDGWGVDKDHPYNAITHAHTPQWNTWWHTQPHSLLEASGEAVGLPPGQMGNSEVGHMHLGAGRLILNDLTRINQAIKQETFASNPALQQLIKGEEGALHVIGLLSPGGVHSQEEHLFAFIKMFAQAQQSSGNSPETSSQEGSLDTSSRDGSLGPSSREGFLGPSSRESFLSPSSRESFLSPSSRGACDEGSPPSRIVPTAGDPSLALGMTRGVTPPLYIHVFLDGRDTPPRSVLSSLERLQAVLNQYPGAAHIASLCGRYYAMDRDQRWERTEQAYQLLTTGKAESVFPDAISAVQAYYQAGISDEFIPPTRLAAFSPIQTGDRLFCFNFRSDRMRQLMRAFISPEFSFFSRGTLLSPRNVVTMTHYAKDLEVVVAYPKMTLSNTLGEVLAQAGLTQLRLAETEKYAHVTYFFNGGIDAPYPLEDRKLIPSPKVATYDLQPAMSAVAITDYLVEQIQACQYDVIICNYANADMLGHTGVMAATTEAISCLDHCMRRVGEAVKAVGGSLLITADHGNAEIMYDESIHQPHTAHTMQPVPFVFVGEGFCMARKQGSLIDVAPTVLTVLGLTPPAEMTGHSLLKRV